MVRQEDVELEQRFGDAYRQYRDSVPALLPKFPV
jgi:protein-S-isoprenylcysteine O-methyltransferase Ste14